MGQKVKKKARSGHKEKRGAHPSPKTVPQQNIPSTTDTVDDRVSVVKERKICAHIEKGIDLVKVSSKIGSSEPIRCQDCREGVVDRRASKGKGKHGKKKGGGSADSRPESKAIWICLECGHFSCGGVGMPTTPQSHAVRHARQARHPLAFQYENPHLRWCFPCSTFIPVEKSEENGEQRDTLSGIVKMMKGRSSEGPSADVDEAWLGSGSVTSEMKLKNTVSSSLDGRGLYAVRGLVNLGNTCFFNSIMQNLLAMDRLQDYFQKLDGSLGPLTGAMKKLYNETTQEAGSKNVINPKSLFGSVCAKAPQFRGYQQHDSHELLRCLLDGLCAEELNARKLLNPSQEDGNPPNLGPTYVDAIFAGQLSSTVCCLVCGHSSTVYEPFLDLSLPVPMKKPPSKKGQPPCRTKKSKLPPKRSERSRPKVNRDADPTPAQTVSNSPTSSKTSCQIQSSVPVSEKMVASSGEPKSLEPITGSTVVNDKDKCSQNILAAQEFENNQLPKKLTEETVASLDTWSWLDYIEPGIASSDENMASQINDVPEIQDSGSKDVVQMQNEVVFHNNLESCCQVCSHYEEKATASVGDFSWLDYLEPAPSTDNHHNGSQINDTPVIHDSGSKDTAQNNAFLQNDSESSGQLCSSCMESNKKMGSSGNSWDDDLPLQIQSSEVLLLPYKEEASTPDDFLRREDEVSSSAVGYEQETFDGFGELFNEPEIDAAANTKPFSSDNNFKSNEAVETSLIDRHSSESDPDEVDNSDFPVSIDSCLAYFTKPELLSNEHAWHCESCSKALQEQRMKLRKKQEKSMTKMGIDGEEDRIQNAPMDCHIPTNVGDPSNGNLKGDVLTTNGTLMSYNGNENCMLETIQKTELSPIVLQLEEGKGERSDALPGQSQSSSSYRTCRQPSFCDQASDFCSANETWSTGCNTDIFEQGESLAGQTELDGNENDEIDSESVKVKRDATKRILINMAPPILTVHLKRFSQDARGRLNKLNGHVNFRDTIDLSPYMDPRCTEREMYRYRLVGVVEHLGTMRGGHYVAYVRGGAKGMGKAGKENGDFMWYHASDAYVRETSLEEVLRCEAYILFYEKF